MEEIDFIVCFIDVVRCIWLGHGIRSVWRLRKIGHCMSLDRNQEVGPQSLKHTSGSQDFSHVHLIRKGLKHIVEGSGLNKRRIWQKHWTDPWKTYKHVGVFLMNEHAKNLVLQSPNSKQLALQMLEVKMALFWRTRTASADTPGDISNEFHPAQILGQKQPSSASVLEVRRKTQNFRVHLGLKTFSEGEVNTTTAKTGTYHKTHAHIMLNLGLLCNQHVIMREKIWLLRVNVFSVIKQIWEYFIQKGYKEQLETKWPLTIIGSFSH